MTEPNKHMNDVERGDLKSIAGRVCIDVYMSFHVSTIKDQPKYIQDGWHVGKELYQSLREQN